MKTNKWVVDASPIILLAKVGLLDVFPKIPNEFCIPESVAGEIITDRSKDQAAKWVEELDVVHFNKEKTISPLLYNLGLGEGEKSVLSYAMRNKGWVAVIDDMAARKCAQTLDIPYTGTIGIMVAAQKYGMIQDIEFVFSQLIEAGCYISPAIIEKALLLSKQ